ncbi:MAG: hypothetical protein IJ890_03020 [Clostridia bacterium]|nr:hypothetical protein [Clostridia bacterium]
MVLNLAQTKLLGLTMKLDLKSREYKMLCNKLEEYKNIQNDENNEKLYKLLNEFQKNHDEIIEIKRQLNEIKNLEEMKQEIKEEKFDYNIVFKSKEKNNADDSKYSNENMMVEYQESFWQKVKKKIKKLFEIF